MKAGIGATAGCGLLLAAAGYLTGNGGVLAFGAFVAVAATAVLLAARPTAPRG